MSKTTEKCVAELRDRGYSIIPAFLSDADRSRALKLVKPLYQGADWARDENNRSLEKNHQFVWNLQNKNKFFIDLLFANPQLDEILKSFLNDPWYRPIPQDKPNYILRSYLARSSAELLPLHIDSMVPYSGDEVFMMQCSFLLEDQSASNGCFQVVPGSHLSQQWADQEQRGSIIDIEAKAGDLIIWDSRLWHGAGKNNGGSTRWCLIATFCRWWLKQMFDIPAALPAETLEELNDVQKSVLGFCSIPSHDEHGWIDMKRGHEVLHGDSGKSD